MGTTAKKTTITKAALKKMTAGKKKAAAMKKGEGYLCAQDTFAGPRSHLRWKVDAAHGGDEEDLGVHQEEQAQRGPHHLAGREVEGGPPGGLLGYVEDGWLHQQALVVRPWAS